MPQPGRAICRAVVERTVYLGIDLQLMTGLAGGEQVHLRLQNSARIQVPAPASAVGLVIDAGAARLLAD